MTDVYQAPSEQAEQPLRLSDLRQSGAAVRVGRRWMVGALLCGLVIFVGAALELWVASTYLHLLTTYGFGQVPSDLLPKNTDTIDNIYSATSLVGPIGLLVCMFTSMYWARAAQERAGVTGYEYSYFWTVTTIFVPIANLFRPWLAFAEIRRIAYLGGRTGSPAGTWAKGAPTSWATIGLAVWLLLGGTTVRAMAQGLPSFQRASAGNISYIFGKYIEFHTIYVGYALGLAIIVTLYLYSTLRETDHFLNLRRSASGLGSCSAT